MAFFIGGIWKFGGQKKRLKPRIAGRNKIGKYLCTTIH